MQKTPSLLYYISFTAQSTYLCWLVSLFYCSFVLLFPCSQVTLFQCSNAILFRPKTPSNR